MPVPKSRTSKSRRGMRRSHHHNVRTFAIVCPGCGESMLRHRACPACGEYRGKKINEAAAQ